MGRWVFPRRLTVTGVTAALLFQAIAGPTTAGTGGAAQNRPPRPPVAAPRQPARATAEPPTFDIITGMGIQPVRWSFSTGINDGNFHVNLDDSGLYGWSSRWTPTFGYTGSLNPSMGTSSPPGPGGHLLASPGDSFYVKADLGQSATRYAYITLQLGYFNASNVVINSSGNPGTWWLEVGKSYAREGTWAPVGAFIGPAPSNAHHLHLRVAYSTSRIDNLVVARAVPGSALYGACRYGHAACPVYYEAEPVNTATGNYTTHVTDFSLPGRGLGVSFDRTYNSGPSGPPPNLVRVPAGGTASYSASRQYSGDYTPADAADGITGNSSATGMSWAVNGWLSGDWWQATWTQPQALTRISLCDRRLAGWYFGSAGRITFSDGSTVNWTGLPDDCGATGANPLTVSFPRKTGITWFRVIGDSGGVGNAGLAEVEAYDDAAPAPESGWSFSYSARLAINADGSRRFYAEDGAQSLFWPNGAGGYIRPAGAQSTLAPWGSGYELTRRDQVRYRFDTTGTLTAMLDRNGNQLTFTYTGGQLTTITDTVGRAITLTYDGNGRLSTVNGPPSRSVSYGWDASGRLTTVTDLRGKVTTYTYDTSNRLLTIVDPNGHTVVTNEYGAGGRISAQTDARGKRGTFTWNPDTQTSVFTDARGGTWSDVYSGNVLLGHTDPLGHTTGYAYDASFNRIAVSDPRGFVTTSTYDGNANVLTRTAPAPLSYLETWTYTTKNDVSTYTDGRGNQTTFGYDPAGNLTSISAPLSWVTQFGRDTGGTGLLVSLTDPRGKLTAYGYDAQANQNAITDPLGKVTMMTYDPAGRMLTMVDPLGNEVGANPADFTTTFTYDAADHLLTVTDPLGGLTTYAYDDAGNQLTITDANNRTTTFAYDAANHMSSVTDARNGVTAYAYDDVGNLVTRTDANTHVTTYAYDLAKRLTSVTDPLNHVWSMTYDNAGNLLTRTDANTKTTTYAYDALNRLTTVTYADPSTPTVTFGYDANGNRTSMTDGAGTETTTYDALNRPTAISRGLDTFGYGYDAAGYVTSRTYPGQTAQTLTYDDAGRLATANGASYTYDAAGNLLTAALPNGLTARYAYDRAGRLLEVAHTTATDTLSRFTYSLDPVGNRTAMTTREGTVTYRYDELHRLTEACWSPTSCPGGPPAPPLACLTCIGGLLTRPAATTTPPPGETYRTYSYDPVGNRLTEASNAGTTTYAYDLADRLTTVTPPGGGPISYSFDNNGNQTAAGPTTYTYDYADRLKTTTVGVTTETYTYAGDGVRLTASTGAAPNQTTKSVWDRNFGLPQLVIERDGADTVLRSYRYGLDLVNQSAGGNTYDYHHDGLGSVVDVTGSTGTSLAWNEFYPYGLVRTAGVGAGAPTNPFNFTGEQLDGLTGLYHLRARQYDASIGRFLSTDPVAPLVTDPYVASYIYGRVSPTNWTDPSGETPALAAAFVAAAAGITCAAVCVAVIVGAVVVTAVVAAVYVAEELGVLDQAKPKYPESEPIWDPRQDWVRIKAHNDHVASMGPFQPGKGNFSGGGRWCPERPGLCTAARLAALLGAGMIVWMALEGRGSITDIPYERQGGNDSGK